MEKKELKKELFEKYNWDRFFTEKVKEDVWEWVEDKLDRAREEGRREAKREAQIEVLTEIFQTCYQEDSKTLELVEEKLSKLTTK